ncbi:MAG: GAF domain-containing protein, partial [Dehalococcoidales bacterium]|nr:GAF domain-containing protein [Dehalococcoidales bacterium]
MVIRQIFNKFPIFSDVSGKPDILKIITVVSPALFILLFEVLRQLIHNEASSIVADTLPVFSVVILAASFYLLVFYLMESKRREDIRYNRELRILYEIGLTINGSLNMDVLLPHTMEKLIQVTGADSGDLFLVNEKNRELSYTLHVGMLPEASGPDSGTLTCDGLVGEAARSNKPIIIQDLKNSGSALNTTLPVTGFRSLAAVPLRSRNGTAGVFALFSLKPGYFKL